MTAGCGASRGLGKARAAQEIYQDVCDGIRSLVSVGYQIHELKLSKQSDTEGDEYLVTDWEPHEGSIVAVPADPTVGVGREAEELFVRSLLNRSTPPVKPPSTTEKATMEKPRRSKPSPPSKLEAQPVDHKRAAEQATAQERQRMRDITALGAKFGKAKEAEAAIEAGTPYDAFRETVFTNLEKSGALKIAEPAGRNRPDERRRCSSSASPTSSPPRCSLTDTLACASWPALKWPVPVQPLTSAKRRRPTALARSASRWTCSAPRWP
jgi:hypothetical protein